MNYEELSVAQLREIAKEKNIMKVSAMKKQELIEALKALDTASAQKTEEKKAVRTGAKKQAKAETEVKSVKEAAESDAEAKKPAKKSAEGKAAAEAKKPVKKSVEEKADAIEDRPAEEPVADAKVKKTSGKKAGKTEGAKSEKSAEVKADAEVKKPVKKSVEEKADAIEDRPAEEPVADAKVKKTAGKKAGKTAEVKPEETAGKAAGAKAEKSVEVKPEETAGKAAGAKAEKSAEVKADAEAKKSAKKSAEEKADAIEDRSAGESAADAKVKKTSGKNAGQTAEVKPEEAAGKAAEAKAEKPAEVKAEKAPEIQAAKPAEVKAEEATGAGGMAELREAAEKTLDDQAAKRRAAAEIMAAAEVREAAQRFERGARPEAGAQQTFAQNRQSGAPVRNENDRQQGQQRSYQTGGQGQQRSYQTGGQGQQRSYQTGGQGQQRSYQTGGQGQQRSYQAGGQQRNSYQNGGQNGQKTYQQGGRSGYQQNGQQAAGRDSLNQQGDTQQPVRDSYSQQRDVQPPVRENYSQQRDAQQPARDSYGQPAAQGSYSQNGDNSAQNSYQAKDPSVVANENMQNEQQQEANRKPLIPDFDYDARSVMTPEIVQLDSGVTKEGILEIMNDGYGFIRCDNFLPGEHDVYVSPAQIRKLNLKTGDIISGNTKVKGPAEKFSALLYVKTVNGRHPSEAHRRPKFEDLTPIFPHDRIHLETPGCTSAMRIVDMLSPIGKGQRGMIVSQPKAGKTTLLKQIAKAITTNYPDMHLIILLIDERPEEVTDMKESIEGKNVEVIYSTFDELPENHKRVSEMVIERAKRLVEHKMDVCVLLDSITRLARAYNLTCAPSGRTLSGGLDPAALHMPKKFFGAARCMREGGSLTILATALVDTGSRMDDVVFEEFKGTGNMELVLDRNLSEKRIFPAIDLPRSSTRRDDLLLSQQELEVNEILRHAFSSARSDQMIEKIINLFANTKTNREFCETVKKTKLNI